MGKQSREKRERKDSMPEKKVKEISDKSGLEKTCFFIIQWGTYLMLFTPLLISTEFFFPFVAPKTVFFRIMVEIILVAYVFLAIAYKKYRPRINALTIAVTIFLLIFTLASFTGVNFSRSFWSTYERMTGLFTMLHLYAFFIVLVSVFKQRKDWARIFGVSVIVGILLSFYILKGGELSTRGGGTIGNTSFMASYLLFDIFFAVVLLFSKKAAWKIFAGISLAIMLPVMLTSTARGAIVSFFVGLFLFGLGYLIFSRRKALKRLAVGIVLAVVIIGLLLAVFQPPVVRDKVDTTMSDMKSRLVVWENGWKGFQERPILGWGPENFKDPFLKYFNSCMFLAECGNEIWFDRVHNIVFDTLVATGILGILSYLAIFGVAIYGLWRMVLKAVERKEVLVAISLAVLLAVYFMQNLLVFDMINTYLVFFLTLAFIQFLTKREVVEEDTIGKRSINSILGTAIVFVMIFVLWFGNIQPMIANTYIIDVIQSSKVDEASIFLQKSVGSWMDKYEAREQFAQKMIRSPYQDISPEHRKSFEEAFELAEAEMEKSCRENYLDFRPHLFLGQLYLHDYRFTNNPEKFVKSEQTFLKAMELSPTNQQAYWNMAELQLTQRRIGETIKYLKEAIELHPRLGHSYWYLAMAYKISEQYELALEEINNAMKYGYNWKVEHESLQRVIEVYIALGMNANEIFNDAELIIFYEKQIRKNPEDFTAWSYLAAAYANIGEFDKAREAATKVLEINPDSRQKIEEFLKTLPEQQ